MSLSAETAKEIIEKAIESNSYSGKQVPKDDAKAVADAEELVSLARDAASSWDDDEDEMPDELREILELADSDGGEEKEEKTSKPAAEKSTRSKPGSSTRAKPKGSKPKEEAEVDFSDDDRAAEEPYEGYGEDTPKVVADSLEPAVDEDDDDGLAFLEHVYVYEISNKNRKRIIDEALRLLEEHHAGESVVLGMINGDVASVEPEEEPGDDDSEPTASGDSYTQEQLEELEKEDLKPIAEALGLDFPKRFTPAGKTRTIDAILEAQEKSDDDGSAEDEDAADPTPEDEAVEAPFEEYDDWSPAEVKEVLGDYLADDSKDSDSDEDKAGALEQTLLYEAQNKNRKSLITFFEKKKEELFGGDGEEPEAEEGGEDGEGEDPEAAAAPDDDDDGESAAPRSSGRGKKAGASAGTRKSRDRSADDEAEYGELIQHVKEKVERENLHVPDPIDDGDIVTLPFDLTTVTEKDLQTLHSAFSAYSYRVGYLLAIAEAHAQAEKHEADEIADALIAQMDADTGITLLKAIAEQEEDVKVWRKRQRANEVLASFLRRERDNYDKTVDRLSRQITARDDEWRHASAPGLKSRGAKK